ncbi:hypothetical protein SD80_031890 [Scytonema tolypothrichoides VB-61278]|nr:hypothetical protein SD80_031890 [Scytonema tolypothrichoides VB-61278]
MIRIPSVYEAYTTYFNCSNAVIEIPYDAVNVADIIAELDARPDHLNRIPKDNFMNSLLRHDWVYRWEQIIEKVRFNSTPEILSRKAYLAKLTDKMKSEC